MKFTLTRATLAGFWLTGAVYAAQNPDVAFITQLKGTVVVQGPQAQRNAVALTKLRLGERLQLKKESQLRIVYFDGGQQETWNGEAKLAVGSAESAKLAGADPEVKKLPSVLSKQLAMTPSGEATSRVGMARLRGSPNAKLAEAEKNYSNLRGATPDDDRTPELYLLAALFEWGRYDRIESVLKDLKSRHPDSSEVAAIDERYSKTLEEARKPVKTTQ